MNSQKFRDYVIKTFLCSDYNIIKDTVARHLSYYSKDKIGAIKWLREYARDREIMNKLMMIYPDAGFGESGLPHPIGLANAKRFVEQFSTY